MNISRRELLNLKGKKVYEYQIEYERFDNLYLRALEEVNAKITLYYDALDQLCATLDIEGDMVCPCAITLEDVNVPFEIHDETRLSFTEEEDAYFVNENLDIKELILTFILPEVPIKVVKNEKIEYPRGDGWRVMTEDDFDQMKKSEIDPRWQKLTEYKFDEEE